MSLEDIVSVSISAQTTTVSRLGFGTPLIARAHNNIIPSLVREYKTLGAMTDDSWPATDPAVLIATKIASQNPKPASWKIGKRANRFTQIIRIIPINVTEGYVYSFDIVVGTVTTTISYTVLASSSVAIICTALQTLIDAVAGITAANNTTHVTVTTDTVGALVDYVGFDEPDNFRIKDMTTDPGIAADLSAIETVDPDGWYGLLLDSNSEAEILAAAAWIEARKKVFICNTTDSECVDNVVTNDVMSDLQSFSYVRTAIIYSQTRLLNFSAAAWVGNRLPTDPGSSTWAFKTLAGVQVDSQLTGGQVAVIESKGGNVYRRIAGVNITTFGVTVGGEYIDVTIFIDWLDARIKERIFGVLVNNAKIPFTDAGVDIMRSQVLAQLDQGIAAGGLAADPAPVVTAPRVADIDPTDKGLRILPDIFFTATLAGAIHKVQVSGVLSI